MVVSKYLRRAAERTRVIASSGNHDLDAHGTADEKVAAWLARGGCAALLTDGEYVEIDDVSITVCPWWDGPHACAEVRRQLARDAARRRPYWIWVYHAPPDASPTSWTGHEHYGDVELMRWVREHQPDLVLTGPCTSRRFDAAAPGWTASARPGSSTPVTRWRPPRPVSSFDTVAKTAEWSSLAGREIVSSTSRSCGPSPPSFRRRLRAAPRPRRRPQALMVDEALSTSSTIAR
mgnify:CR=1 FL=1